MSLEDQIKALETALSGADDDTDKQHAMRMAIVKQAADDMSDEEKKEARAAFDIEDDDDKKGKKGMDDEDDVDDIKKGKKGMDDNDGDNIKKGKKGMDDEDETKKALDEKEEKIASLTASVNYLTAKPIIEKMLTARKEKGMSEKNLKLFQKSLYGKSIDQIKQRHDEDQILFAKEQPLIAVENTGIDTPFNGNNDIALSASDEEISLEAMSE